MDQKKMNNESRRDFLKKSGKAAAAVPAAMLIMNAASKPNLAMAASGGRVPAPSLQPPA